jgi:hypothetical protein
MPRRKPDAPHKPRGRPISTGSSKHQEVRWRPSYDERAMLDRVKATGESDADVCRRALRLLCDASGS